jgi:hypothetical protein
MNSGDVAQWDNAVNEEHNRFVKHKVWKAVLRRDIPAAAKILTSSTHMGNGEEVEWNISC